MMVSHMCTFSYFFAVNYSLESNTLVAFSYSFRRSYLASDRCELRATHSAR